MTAEDVVRDLALALPDVVERDHHGFPSFRFGGRIIATLPTSNRLRVMLDEHGIRSEAVSHPDSCREFYWGKKLSALEVDLDAADDALVDDLLHQAWERRAP
ncbi:MAG TPA: hypothetical protein DIW80_14645 [Gordonia polyisoprenivorans]|uniref:MmcQ/YjbR family DNA-binding protein n=1 Tax=Gordonia polyisoprenivorans TaxID=84595 RepID=A0A846WJ42_9ACTN|nr:hypothetical protein [Gordonia polyisoprenivorans]NKY00870.1 hypothetical protein [Gordonia polyisoprenivorans]OZC33400.1 hypothetical protein CJJ17_19335 [Gordonia polyisoprenivorans]UZF56816.1 hypothetical protein LH935_02060 [Gordonia polyisoprenivorans]GAB22626.1 hypothetical protein GOPIP_031_02480 [Gordonia polyisoprenivorans NBRC 16320 = JCM 10675]HCS58272.1 hypothetical protein [Gordonia polyisoprenivorans]